MPELIRVGINIKIIREGKVLEFAIKTGEIRKSLGAETFLKDIKRLFNRSKFNKRFNRIFNKFSAYRIIIVSDKGNIFRLGLLLSEDPIPVFFIAFIFFFFRAGVRFEDIGFTSYTDIICNILLLSNLIITGVEFLYIISINKKGIGIRRYSS